MYFKGFNDRPFFDGFDREERGGGRGGGNMNDIRGGGRGGGRERPAWGDREGDRAPSNHFEKDKPDKERDNGKRATSRWTNSSPKSVVSDEENWDDLEDSDKPEASKPSATVEKTVRPVALPQTEPIDDDSQEDDFNDFDDSSPLPTSDEKLTATPAKANSPERSNDEADNEDVPATVETHVSDFREASPPSKTINMFSDDIPPVEAVNSPESNVNFSDDRPAKSDTENCDGGNTTPLYDEPHQENRQNNDHEEFRSADNDSERPMSADDKMSPSDMERVTEDIHENELPSYDKNDEAQGERSRSQSPASHLETMPTSQSPTASLPPDNVEPSAELTNDDAEARTDE